MAYLKFEDMNFIDRITSQIRDFIIGVSPAQKDLILEILQITIDDIKNNKNIHK